MSSNLTASARQHFQTFSRIVSETREPRYGDVAVNAVDWGSKAAFAVIPHDATTLPASSIVSVGFTYSEGIFRAPPRPHR